MDEPAAARHASSPFAAPIMAMGDAAIVRLSGTPWCAALINDPAWTPTRTESRVPKPTSEDSFFAETLGTQRTIRACLTLRPAHEEVGGDWAYRHIRVLMELGDGLNGHPRICHGGFVATMLDEVLGALIVLDIEARRRRGEAAQNMSCFTAYLNTSYKKPVPTPGVVLCTAKFERRERNKLYVSGTVEDGSGTVYAVGEAMFVETRTKL